ncbi:MAG TPA: sigma-70 family RNA polymerase sigma factor [Opitutaceae bacterium]|nr:sigma-70 family RNA polymerase sigma factor [Opitutaceae bacterium]
MSEGQPLRAPGGGAFPTTHWSLIVHAGAASESQAHAALETLCRQYWYPLYAFVRRTGRAHHEAEDCTQDFLARLLSTDGFSRAHPERGRFRAFLLSSLRNFLTNDWHRSHAAKRGGGTAVVSLDLERAEDRFEHEPKDSGLTPEQAYDRSWALGLVDSALASLRAEYRESGRDAHFAALVPFVWEGPVDEPASESDARSGMTAHAFTVALHRLRRRLGVRLRTIVAETVADPKDVDSELRHLIAALRGGVG